jgi:hypothetical protein
MEAITDANNATLLSTIAASGTETCPQTLDRVLYPSILGIDLAVPQWEGM